MINTIPHKNLVAESIFAVLVSKNIKEAAELLEVDRTTLYKRFKTHPEIKDVASAIFEYSQEALKLASAKAVNVLVKSLDSMSVEVRMEAAKEILDRGGLTKENTRTNTFEINKGSPMQITFVADDAKHTNVT